MVVRGNIFNTAYESRCVALDEPDEDGIFLGIDSDGVKCQYHVGMIVQITGKISNPDYADDSFVLWLQQLWQVEVDDRSIKNQDDQVTPLEELNANHMDRVTMYEMGWWN
jgi:hypothetical protein